MLARHDTNTSSANQITNPILKPQQTTPYKKKIEFPQETTFRIQWSLIHPDASLSGRFSRGTKYQM
jgi:hypothetical protein